MPPHTMPNDDTLRDLFASRARELGSTPRAAGLRLEWFTRDAFDGVQALRARWDADDGPHGIAGLLLDGELDTYPLQALGKLFDRWTSAGAALPPAAEAARLCAFILDPLGRRKPLVDEHEIAALAAPGHAPGGLRRPRFDIDAAGLRLSFWWIGPRGASQLQLRHEAGRPVVVGETPAAGPDAPASH